MKLFLHINAKKIVTVIFYFDNYLWKVGIQENRRSRDIKKISGVRGVRTRLY